MSSRDYSDTGKYWWCPFCYPETRIYYQDEAIAIIKDKYRPGRLIITRDHFPMTKEALDEVFEIHAGTWHISIDHMHIYYETATPYRPVSSQLKGGVNQKIYKISEFYGITITMSLTDQYPEYFIATYKDHMAMISIKELKALRGGLPERAKSMVLEWAKSHQEELLKAWQLAKEHSELFWIEPLD